MNKKRPFFSTSIMVTIGRAGGLLIPFVIAFVFGAGPETDAFFLAFTLMMALVTFFNPVFELVMVPFLSELKNQKGRVAETANHFVLLCLPVLVLVGLAGVFALKPFLIRFSGLDEVTAGLSARLFLEMMPLLVLWIWSAGLNSVFYTYQSFWFPAVSPLLRSVSVIVFALLGKGTAGVHALTLGYCVGEVVRWLAGWGLLVRRSWWKLSVSFGGTWRLFRGFLGQVGYQMLAILAISLVPVVDQWFASWFGSGSLTLMSYADRFFKVPHQFFVAGMLPIFLSHWSDSYVQENREVFWRKVEKDTRRVLWGSIGFSLVAIVAGLPLLCLFFRPSDLTLEQLRQLAWLLGWLLAGFAPAAVNMLYIRVLFVMKKSAVFCVQSWIRLLLNVVLNAVFIRIWGLTGIAMSTAVTFILTALWLHGYVRRQRNAPAGEAA